MWRKFSVGSPKPSVPAPQFVQVFCQPWGWMHSAQTLWLPLRDPKGKVTSRNCLEAAQMFFARRHSDNSKSYFPGHWSGELRTSSPFFWNNFICFQMLHRQTLSSWYLHVLVAFSPSEEGMDSSAQLPTQLFSPHQGRPGCSSISLLTSTPPFDLWVLKIYLPAKRKKCSSLLRTRVLQVITTILGWKWAAGPTLQARGGGACTGELEGRARISPSPALLKAVISLLQLHSCSNGFFPF